MSICNAIFAPLMICALFVGFWWCRHPKTERLCEKKTLTKSICKHIFLLKLDKLHTNILTYICDRWIQRMMNKKKIVELCVHIFLNENSHAYLSSRIGKDNFLCTSIHEIEKVDFLLFWKGQAIWTTVLFLFSRNLFLKWCFHIYIFFLVCLKLDALDNT